MSDEQNQSRPEPKEEETPHTFSSGDYGVRATILAAMIKKYPQLKFLEMNLFNRIYQKGANGAEGQRLIDLSRILWQIYPPRDLVRDDLKLYSLRPSLLVQSWQAKEPHMARTIYKAFLFISSEESLPEEAKSDGSLLYLLGSGEIELDPVTWVVHLCLDIDNYTLEIRMLRNTGQLQQWLTEDIARAEEIFSTE